MFELSLRSSVRMGQTVTVVDACAIVREGGGEGGGERVVSGIQHPRNSITLNHWQLSVEDLFKSISLSELTAVCVQGLDREQPRKRPQKGDHRSEVMRRSSDEQK